MANTYQKLQKFLPPSYIHVPPVVNDNAIKDVIFTANELLSDLSPKENDHEFDDLIFPEHKPGPSIFPFTKTQYQTLCVLSNMDTSQVISALNNYTPLKPIKSFNTLIQMDGGANRSITNDLSNLQSYWKIDPVKIHGISGTVICSHHGIFNIPTRSGSHIPILMYYSEDTSCTVISPNDAVIESSKFSAWTQHANFMSNNGHIRFHSTSGLLSEYVDLVTHNRLWYLSSNPNQQTTVACNDDIINHISMDMQYKLWHHRLAHPGLKQMSNIPKACDGVPALNKHPFFKCEECITYKLTKMIRNYGKKQASDYKPGECFQMDFGFVRGQIRNNSTTSNSTSLPLQTCHNGYNCYLLITDVCTCYTWVFLLASKHPPTDIVSTFIKRFGTTNGTIRTDKGGELANSISFRKTVRDCGYNLQTTAPNASFQIGIVE